jgi:hypothetical protein
MPQYQGVWTLQQQMQALTSGQWVTDPNFKNTTLLLQGDSGANGAQNNLFLDTSPNQFAITRNGNTTQGSFTPFSLQPGAWGNYFDGSSYLSNTSPTSVVAAGTSNFTAEFWVYPTTDQQASTYASIFHVGSSTSGSFAISLLYSATNAMKIRFGTTVADYDSTNTIAPNQWYHIAVVRSGTGTNQTTIYVNGASFFTFTLSENLSNSSGLYVGSTAYNVSVRRLYGYVSNLRWTVGSALYTSSFTPSTVPLTTTSQGATASQVEFLSCQDNRFIDNSTNAFAITANGTPSVQAFSPFAPQYQWTSSVIGGSAYMDGSGDYLTVSNPGSGLTFGANPFTIEAWVYPATAGSGNQYVCWIYGNSVDIIAIYYDASTKTVTFQLRGTNLASTSISHTTGGFNPLQWNHLALVRNGTTFAGFVNGVISSTTIASNAAFNEAQAQFFTQPQIGATSNPVGSYINGYVSGWRALKGTAQYTATFTPPTAPPTAITNTATLLNFTNAGIYDGTMKNDLETAGNAQISTAVVKYGSGSMYFDGSGDYLRPNSGNIFNFGTGDFTVEFWLYLNATTAQTFIDCRPGSAGDYILFDYDPTLRLYVGSTTVLSGKSLSTGQWYHIALARSGSTVKYFVNGVQEASATMTTNLLSASNPYIGSNYVPGAYLNGYIDDLRITKGIARYITNFTPPLVALPRQ